VEAHITDVGLFPVTPEAYGAKYHDHVFEQYKLYVEMADRISARRATANTFFLTANTVLVSMLGALFGTALATTAPRPRWLIVFGVGGMLFCFAWWRLVYAYRQLTNGKFQVIEAIEARLPLALFQAEWKVLGEGKDPKRYRPLTDVETSVPCIFSFMHGLILISGVYSLIVPQ